MPYELIDRDNWVSFIESFSKQLAGTRVEIEIMGLDLGDQIEAEWLPLRRLRFEEDADRMHIVVAEGDREIDHPIEAPVEMWAEIAQGELDSLVFADRDGHKEIVRFRAPLGLPGEARDVDGGGASPP